MANLTQLTAAQRMDMIQKGLNPLVEAHISTYLNGGKGSVQTNNERLQAVLGERMNAGFGHGNDKVTNVAMDSNGSFVPGGGGGSTPIRQGNNEQSLRESLMQDMDDYASSTGNMSSGGLQSLRETPQAPKGKLTVNEVKENGNKLATAYYNAFISSLKKPSTQANMNVFKALKTMLEYEQKVSSNAKAKQIFNESVKSITDQMYNQIKG